MGREDRANVKPEPEGNFFKTGKALLKPLLRSRITIDTSSEARLHLYSLPPECLDLLDQRVVAVELEDVVCTANALPVDHDVGYRRTARHCAQPGLHLEAERVFVELDDVWCGLDGVFLEKEALCSFAVWAV